jgi:small GTP-binding protein
MYGNDDDDENYIPTELKVVVIGVSGVGKTSLCVRYVHDEFQDFSPTIGASFLQKIVSIGRCPLCLQIWDTAGQERFRAMTPLYYRNAKAAIVVFDASNDQTFHQAKRCLQDLKKHVPDDIVLSICANKIDKMENSNGVRSSPSQIDEKLKDAVDFAKQYKAAFFQTSAKDNIGVNEIFQDVARRLLKMHIKENERQLMMAKRRKNSESNPYYIQRQNSFERVRLNSVKEGDRVGCC